MKLFIVALLATLTLVQPLFRRFPGRGYRPAPGFTARVEPVAKNPQDFHPDDVPRFYDVDKTSPYAFQTAAFTKINENVTIAWANKATVVISPFNRNSGSAAELRTIADPASDDQKWKFVPVPEATNQFYITNVKSKLVLTFNSFPSPIALAQKGLYPNQKFYVNALDDGTFYISTVDSNLYLDALDVNTINPVVIVRNYEGDVTQKWLIN